MRLAELSRSRTEFSPGAEKLAVFIEYNNAIVSITIRHENIAICRESDVVRLVHAPGEKYPYQFKIVNDTAINAFALPGGFVYVNRGAIEAADNEAQIAGVMAHEIGHVVMRHGTNQVSKAYLAQAPLAVLGGALGNNSIGSVLGQLGVSLGLNSLFLKYSRDAETQADVLGTQILHDSGYDPKAMVDFFEKIQAESKDRAIQFLSDHPNPENRITNVQHEIERLGGQPPSARSDSPDFHTVKMALAAMPAPRKGAAPTSNRSDNKNGRPQPPSTRMATYSGQDLQFRYPENWQRYGQGTALTFAPDGGIHVALRSVPALEAVRISDAARMTPNAARAPTRKRMCIFPAQTRGICLAIKLKKRAGSR